MLPYESQAVQGNFAAVGIFIIVILVLCVLEIVAWVVFSFGLYKDAEGNYNQNPLMWALLSGFLGLIPTIIYFCVRTKNSYRFACPHCRNPLQVPTPVCPFCRNAIDSSAIPPENPAYVELRRKGKNQMITGAILYGLTIILTIVFTVVFSFWFAAFINAEIGMNSYSYWNSSLSLFFR